MDVIVEFLLLAVPVLGSFALRCHAAVLHMFLSICLVLVLVLVLDECSVDEKRAAGDDGRHAEHQHRLALLSH